MSKQVAQWQLDFVSPEWQVAEAAAKQLLQVGGEHIVDFLFACLGSPEVLLRNRAALVLADLGDNRAVAPLLAAIQQPANAQHRGTLVYALAMLDCSHLLKDLFELLFYGSAEVKVGALLALDYQEFEFDRADLYAIQAHWTAVQQQPGLCPNYEAFQAQIQAAVDGYVAYLAT